MVENSTMCPSFHLVVILLVSFVTFAIKVVALNVISTRNASFELAWRCNVSFTATPLRTQGVSSLTRCAALCVDDSPVCVGFLWDKSGQGTYTCTTYDATFSSPCNLTIFSNSFSFYENPDALLSTTLTTTAQTTSTTQETTTANPCQNSGTYNASSCLCEKGCSGQYCQNCYQDCAEGTSAGETGTDVVSYIKPINSPVAFKTLCNFDFGVTYIQYRRVGTLDFNRDWQSYTDGFGDLNGDFWLGNTYINYITQQSSYTCGVRLFDNTFMWQFDSYSNFKVANESEDFRVSFTSDFYPFGMSPSDSSKDSNGQPFGTHDHDPTGCAALEQAGWWYNSGCTTGANANGNLPFDWSSILNVTKTGIGLY